jgi:hypothetical protein
MKTDPWEGTCGFHKPTSNTERTAMSHAVCDEAIAVELFQAEQFQRLGYSHYDALCAIDQRVDWHDVERLLNHGCSHDVAIELSTPIESPLDQFPFRT